MQNIVKGQSRSGNSYYDNILNKEVALIEYSAVGLLKKLYKENGFNLHKTIRSAINTYGVEQWII